MDELIEFRELVAAIKSDRDAQKAKEVRDGWTKHVSLSMIFIAVLAATCTQKSGGFSSKVMKQLNEATFNQAAASDQWSLYQAKSIKQSLAENEAEAVDVSDQAGQKRQAEMLAKSKRYDGEKKDITKEATALEAKRDLARQTAEEAAKLGQGMGLASTLFQVAIAIGGVCLIVKKRWLWGVSLTLAFLACAQMIRVLYFM